MKVGGVKGGALMGHFEGRYLEAQEREFFDGNLFSDVRALC
jgi:hypothetical protein